MRQKFISNTGILVIINVVVFFLSLIVDYAYPNFTANYFALSPSLVLQGQHLWTIFTSIFFHAGLNHLIVNMISLIFIGGFVEKLIGKRFLYLYFIGGVVASLFFVFLAGFFGTTVLGEKLFGGPDSLAVGASGAIFALGGLLAVLTPKMKVLVFFVIPTPMWIAMVILLFAMWLLSASASLSIGNTAHLGGLVVGLIYGFYLKQKYPQKTRLISQYFNSY